MLRCIKYSYIIHFKSLLVVFPGENKKAFTLSDIFSEWSLIQWKCFHITVVPNKTKRHVTCNAALSY